MSFLEEYKQKLVSADEAVKIVKSGDWVAYSCDTGRNCVWGKWCRN
jgi:acyl-CoA hydrolase